MASILNGSPPARADQPRVCAQFNGMAHVMRSSGRLGRCGGVIGIRNPTQRQPLRDMRWRNIFASRCAVPVRTPPRATRSEYRPRQRYAQQRGIDPIPVSSDTRYSPQLFSPVSKDRVQPIR